jgi:hypothetical protein
LVGADELLNELAQKLLNGAVGRLMSLSSGRLSKQEAPHLLSLLADIRNAIGRTTATDLAADTVSAGRAGREAPGMPLELNAHIVADVMLDGADAAGVAAAA